MVSEFWRLAICYRGNSSLYQGMMSAAIMPKSLTSRAFADSPSSKDSPARNTRASLTAKER
eukprot:4734060-Pleurochrysis_carterae.AAC.1